jgi:hypothetical protein
VETGEASPTDVAEYLTTRIAEMVERPDSEAATA